MDKTQSAVPAFTGPLSLFLVLFLPACSGDLSPAPGDGSPDKGGEASVPVDGMKDGPASDQASKDLPAKDSPPGACVNHCKNGLWDCGETYVDCGGKDCGACKPVKLASTADFGGYPRLSAAVPNRVMVVWYRNAPGGDNRIRWRCFDGKTWSGVQKVTSGKGHQEYPWIVSDSKGALPHGA